MEVCLDFRASRVMEVVVLIQNSSDSFLIDMSVSECVDDEHPHRVPRVCPDSGMPAPEMF